MILDLYAKKYNKYLLAELLEETSNSQRISSLYLSRSKFFLAEGALKYALCSTADFFTASEHLCSSFSISSSVSFLDLTIKKYRDNSMK